MKARLSALKTLIKVTQGQSLPSALSNTPVSDQDEALRKALCVGVCRWHVYLQNQLSTFLKKPLKKKDQDIQLILLLGLYQLHWLNIPDYAAINETTELAKSRKKIWAKKLINAVLQQAKTEDLKPQTGNAPKSPVFPEWFQSHIQSHWSQAIPDITQAHLQAAATTLRINPTKTSRIDYLAQLASAGIQGTLGQLSEMAITLEKPPDITTLPGFSDGLFAVQDESAQLASSFLDLQPGLRVLDACAAPGGKSLSILETCPDIDALVLLEKDAARAKKIEENLARHQIETSRYRLYVTDATQTNSKWQQTDYDRILLDAPCSASGITRRHPDILLLRKPEDIPALAEQQRQLLHHLWPHLKPGGLLLYATCSILPAENSEQISHFLNTTPDAHLMPLPPLASSIPMSNATGLQILPSPSGPDGFYYALLKKVP